MLFRSLQKRAATPKSIGQDASRQALDRLGDSLAMRETVGLVGDVDDQAWATIGTTIATIGVSSVDALKAVVAVEQDATATRRAEDLIVGFGAKAVGRLTPLIGDSRWFVQRRGAQILGRIAAPEAVPLLQPLLRQSDTRVAQAAVAALAAIPDPAAARAIQTVLRAASGDMRRAVTAALVAGKDPRVVPMLVQILTESEPLGKDHQMVLETIDALASVGADRAVPILVTLAHRKRFFGGAKLRALKERSVDALVQVATPKAAAAIKEAAERGDRALRKIAAARSRG